MDIWRIFHPNMTQEQLFSDDESSDWEGTDYQSESERESDFEDEVPIEDVILEGGEAHAIGSTMRAWDSAPDTDDEEEEEGYGPVMIVCNFFLNR